MAIVFTVQLSTCHRSVGAAPPFTDCPDCMHNTQGHRNTQIITIHPSFSRNDQSSPPALLHFAHPSTARTTSAGPRRPHTSSSNHPASDLDFGRPTTPLLPSYSYHTVTEPRLIQSQSSPRFINARLFLDFAQRDSFSSSPPVRSAQSSLALPFSSTRLSNSPRQSRLLSRAVSSPSTACPLAPIWSCHSILTALPTPDSAACLLALSLYSHAAVADRLIPHPHHPKPFSTWFGSQDTTTCLGHLHRTSTQ